MAESAAVSHEESIIIPPPSPLNPIPSLSIALRVDNQDQFLQLLQTDPRPQASTAPFRQLLVFGTHALRTLLLRQVASDPHTRTTFATKKQNWDGYLSFPKMKGNVNIAGSRVLRPDYQVSPRVAEHEPEWEEEDTVINTVDVITYFCAAADLKQVQSAALKILSMLPPPGAPSSVKASNSDLPFHRIVLLPQPTALVMKMLSNLGLTRRPQHVSIHTAQPQLSLDVFPLATDVYSLEYEPALKEASAEGTPSPLIEAVARAILKIQDVCGGQPIPRIQGYGVLAEEVIRKMMSLTVDEYLASGSVDSVPTGQGCDIATLLVLDRRIDLVTPMISPLTYEGLLDDVVGIDAGFIAVDTHTLSPPDDQEKSFDNELVALALHASDPLYEKVRDQHVEQFGTFLQQQAVTLRESHAQFTNTGATKELHEIHQFVKNIPVFTQNLRSLTNHIHLAELVKHKTESTAFREQWQWERSLLECETLYDTLEELVASQRYYNEPYRLLRLLCLQSLCTGGIRSSRYDQWRKDIIQTYGYEFAVLLWQNLEQTGLLRRREGLWLDSASPFHTMRRSLILINAEVDTMQDPDDISYVTSGYAPLSVRLLQTAVKQGWGGRDEVLRELPGRLVDVIQTRPPQDLATALKTRPATVTLAEGVVATTNKTKPVLLVVYVGGVTYSELASLRFLSKRPTFPYSIICLTTKVINGSTLIQSLM